MRVATDAAREHHGRECSAPRKAAAAVSSCSAVTPPAGNPAGSTTRSHRSPHGACVTVQLTWPICSRFRNGIGCRRRRPRGFHRLGRTSRLGRTHRRRRCRRRRRYGDVLATSPPGRGRPALAGGPGPGDLPFLAGSRRGRAGVTCERVDQAHRAGGEVDAPDVRLVEGLRLGDGVGGAADDEHAGCQESAGDGQNTSRTRHATELLAGNGGRLRGAVAAPHGLGATRNSPEGPPPLPAFPSRPGEVRGCADRPADRTAPFE